jgi:hypothetical protein
MFKKHFNIYTLYASFFKYIPTTLVSNMFLSLKYVFLQKLTISINSRLQYKSVVKPRNLSTIYVYKQPIKHTSIVFFKNKLNNTLYYNLYVLLTNYMCYKNNYKFNLTNLPLNTNFHIFTFINLFYFKIRNY